MITQSELKEILHYDPDTGIFTWIKKTSKKIIIGDEAGTKDKINGYRNITINYTPYREHRLVWLYIHGIFPINFIDHINGIKDDNRLINLREANHSQNMANRIKRKDNDSGLKGVTWRKDVSKWKASITIDKKTLYLGYFDNKEDAHEAYKQAAIKYHGEFANY